jgi:hypothetical protein
VALLELEGIFRTFELKVLLEEMRLIHFLSLAVLIVLGSVSSTAQLEDSHSSESESSQKDDSNYKIEASRVTRSAQQILESNTRRCHQDDSSVDQAIQNIDSSHSYESDSESTDSAQETNIEDNNLSVGGLTNDDIQSNKFNDFLADLK